MGCFMIIMIAGLCLFPSHPPYKAPRTNAAIPGLLPHPRLPKYLNPPTDNAGNLLSNSSFSFVYYIFGIFQNILSLNAKKQTKTSATEDWGLRTEDWRLRNEDWRLTTDNWKLTINNWQLKTDNWQLTTEEWQLTNDKWWLMNDNWILKTDGWRLTTDNWQQTPDNQICLWHLATADNWQQTTDI